MDKDKKPAVSTEAVVADSKKEITFLCEFCKKTFLDSLSLETHKNKHHTGKPRIPNTKTLFFFFLFFKLKFFHDFIVILFQAMFNVRFATGLSQLRLTWIVTR